MKFQRNARLLRSRFDAAPFATVFFLLVIFLMLTALIPTPGLPLRLPVADNLPGLDKPAVTVAIDANGRFYFANQLVVSEVELKLRLAAAVKNSRQPLALVVQADKAVTYEQLVRLTLLARNAGIQNALLATLPRVTSAPAHP
jgi:biopolymer transport protein ExbD